jgi:acetoin utilization deacetylase AcuC-like enzyme
MRAHAALLSFAHTTVIDCSHKTVGTKLGEGYTVNIAWEGPGASDSEYIAAFQRVVLPIATAFKPQVCVYEHSHYCCACSA